MSREESGDQVDQSGGTPDLSVTWRVSDAPGSAGRHLKLLEMLFGPTDATEERS